MTSLFNIRNFTVSALAALLLTTALHAHEYKTGELTIGHPWIRATLKGAQTAGGYLKITNSGTQTDRLTGGTIEGAKIVEVHHMAVENNIMKMRRVSDGLEIGAGETVDMQPAGPFHLMIMGSSAPYKEGDKVKGTLIFEKAGTVEVEFKVQPMVMKKEDSHTSHGDGAKMEEGHQYH